MQRIAAGIKTQRVFLASTVVYFLAAVFLFPVLRFFVDNPDTISYITIAKKYGSGYFANAINGYWSPLITWMLAPFLTYMTKELATFKILQLVIGWFALMVISLLVHSLIQAKFFRWVLCLICIPFILSCALLNLTPDLLFLTMILFYLTLVSEREFFNHRHFGLIAGVLGLLMYFTKAFGFVFFLAHFTILFFKNYLHTREYAFRVHLRNNFFQALACFVCVAGIWIYLISNKYGHFTISENVAFNLSKEVAANSGEIKELPVLFGGLYKPVNPTAVNAWEDPGIALGMNSQGVLQEGVLNYLAVVKRNVLAVYYFDFRNQTGAIFLVLLLYLVVARRRDFFKDEYIFSLLLAVLIIYGGYSLILVHARYTWTSTLLMMILSSVILEDILLKGSYWKAAALPLFLVLAILFAKRPVKEILFSADRDIAAGDLMEALINPVHTIRNTYAIDLRLRLTREDLSTAIKQGNIISLKGAQLRRDSYTHSSLIAMSSGSHYYGQLDIQSLNSEVVDRSRIHYLLVYSVAFASFPGWKKIYSDPTIPLALYERDR